MPHSTAAVPMLSENLDEEDSFLPDAPEQVLDPTIEDGNMHMKDVSSQLDGSTGVVLRTDVKLEDLFKDDNDDEEDELSGLGVSGSNNESNSPEAPLWAYFSSELMTLFDLSSQTDRSICDVHGPRGHASILPTPFSVSLPLPMAESLGEAIK